MMLTSWVRTWMGSPVRGLRAVRAERTEVAKDPKPTSETVVGWGDTRVRM